MAWEKNDGRFSLSSEKKQNQKISFFNVYVPYIFFCSSIKSDYVEVKELNMFISVGYIS